MKDYIICFLLRRVKHKQPDELSSNMLTPIVFGVYGESNSGKTMLIEQLVSRLSKEGYATATIKQTDKTISMDMTNKDTWRHHAAGASLVVFSSRSETDFLLKQPLHIHEVIQRIRRFGLFDIILIEGANDPSIPKILVGSGKKRRNTVAVYKDNLPEILQIIKRDVQKQQNVSSISISVNGKDIPLSPFPAQIITNTFIGMLNSLKGVTSITEATITIKR